GDRRQHGRFDAGGRALVQRLRRAQYGGAFCSRCARAASLHPARASANREKLRSRETPAAPIGCPPASSVLAIRPTAIVLEITTMPISERMPCQTPAARTPEKRPAE